MEQGIWSRFYESSTMPTHRSYFDYRFNDTYVGFMKRHSDYHVNIYSAALTQFDGRARGDDVMGNLTVSKLRASQVSVGKLAYRCCDDS